MRARRHLPACLLAALLALAALAPAAAQASFGIESLSATALKGGSVDRQAGSHPDEFDLAFKVNVDSEGHPEGTMRDLIVDLPPGMVGNPLAVPRCPQVDFNGQTPQCPGNTQIGVAHVKVAHGESAFTFPLYNLVPRLGVPASFGLTLFGINGILEASVRTGSDYGASVSDVTLPTGVEIEKVTATTWGVPGASSHDPERFCPPSDGTGVPIEGCESGEDLDLGKKPRPFLTLPTSCTGPLKTTLHVDSLEEPGVFVSKSAFSEDEGSPAGLTDCEAPPFTQPPPTLTAQPEATASDSPTGLHVHIHIPQNEDPEGLATADLKDTVVTLPAGVTADSSAADGLGACSPAQADLQGPGPASCPDSSKVGTVEVHSPLVDHPLAGSVYLAAQKANPFGSLLALYIAVDDPVTGVVVKQAIEVQPDPVTGQLTAITRGIPQLPFEDLDFSFFGGPRAALTTPPTCGTYTTEADLTPWTAPEGEDAFPSDPFSVASGPGGACAGSEAQMPNAPSFEAGTAFPLAASYSPFVLKLARENGSQRFAALNVTLPPGVSAKLAGVKECSDAQIAAAEARKSEGEGALEQASPSCPQASEVGVVNVGAGSGNPFYVQGRAYLAGPYKGAPLSLAIITPAVAGPFDLGVVVVRSALYLDETTAQATVKSDPLPTILKGIPLDVRSVAVRVDRPGFSLNPTSCEEMAVTGQEISAAGQAAPLRSRFQVGGCKGLGFSPKLALSMKGATRRSGHPAFRTVLTQPKGQANIARVVVTLPATEFIDQNHIANPCTRPQFAEGKCPPGSVLGKIRAFTPLLDNPLEGLVYFRSNGGERALPDVVADLNGQVHVVLVGFVDSAHKKGSESSRVRTTFATVPDAPVTKAVLELNGGKKGLLVNSADICKVPNKATVKIRAQNGKTRDLNSRIATSCSSK